MTNAATCTYPLCKQHQTICHRQSMHGMTRFFSDVLSVIVQFVYGFTCKMLLTNLTFKVAELGQTLDMS